MLAQGLADIALSMEGGKTQVSDVFKEFVHALLPFVKTQEQELEKKMKQVMKEEVAGGIITFKPVADQFLRQKLKTMEVDADFRRKIAERKKPR